MFQSSSLEQDLGLLFQLHVIKSDASNIAAIYKSARVDMQATHAAASELIVSRPHLAECEDLIDVCIVYSLSHIINIGVMCDKPMQRCANSMILEVCRDSLYMILLLLVWQSWLDGRQH